MTWSEPTQAQCDQAVNHGIEYALDEISQGAVAPAEHPLSGQLRPVDVAANVGYLENLSAHGGAFADGVTELGAAWEQGYSDTWSVYLANIQRPQ